MNRNIFLLSKDKGTLITLNTYITMCSSLAICIYIFSCSDVRLLVVIYLSVKQQVALSLSLFAIPLSPSLSHFPSLPIFTHFLYLPFPCSPFLLLPSLSLMFYFIIVLPPPLPSVPFTPCSPFSPSVPSLLPSFPHSVRLALPPSARRLPLLNEASVGGGPPITRAR